MEPLIRRHGRAIRWTVSTVGIVAVLAVAFVAFDNRPSSTLPSPAQPDVEQPSAERPEIDAVRRQIAAESRGEVRAVPVRAPQQHANGSTADGGDRVTPAPVPVPPDGYSFTSTPTSLEQVPHQTPTDASAPVESQRNHDLDWLFNDVSATAIVRQARRTQRDWVFGWLRLADGANVADVGRAVSRFGIDILGVSGRLLRAKLPANEASLAAAIALEAVSDLGVVPPQHKAPPAFQAELQAAPWRSMPVLITLMTNDEDGRWRRALLAHGAEVGRFDADIRAYAANIDVAAFDAIVQADFVLAVEPLGILQATHDTAVPAMGADAVRFHADAPGLFSGTGGGAVPIGVMDTGLNTNHLDIASHRQSICGANFVPHDHRTEDADLWIDENGHGTHVTGTIAGNGFTEAKYAGMAPAVAHIRFAKVLNRSGSGSLNGIFRGMDFLTRASGCGAQAVAVKPLVVNMSLAASSRTWRGRSSGERKLDAVVWGHRQLYVVAQSNSGINGFSGFGAAKSSLSVGAIQDDGELAVFSSWGPTFDGRLAPQVVATGVDINSAKGNGRRGGYNRFNGTSMASPAVAGVAALLMDAVADYREHPALVRARLMASAIKPDAWLDASDVFPATNSAGPGVLQAQFGLGKASARTSVLQRKEADGWESGAATSTPTHGSASYQDIEVPEGASRLDVVLAWDEPPADTIGSTVLNDLDLWLDKDGDCEATACGEHASTSRQDNVEWITLKNPAAGTYRAGVVAHRIYTAAPRAGLAWTVVRGPSTPTLRLALDEMRTIGEREYRVALSLSVDGYVAASVRVGASGCRTAAGAECFPGFELRPVTGEDSIAHSPAARAKDVLVGEVAVGERQQIVFDVDLKYTDDATRLYFKADAWNANSAIVSVALPASDSLGAQSPAEVAPPANDDFADATALNGASGSIAVDLLATTFEPGEPPALYGKRPSASVWFRWTAPAQGAVRFGVSASAGVDILQGQHIAALTQLAVGNWGISFFAEEGETYFVRVSQNDYGLSTQMTLHWSQGPRPTNDDFMTALELAGTEGDVSGDNRSATLEPGEQVGNLGATVWYRWTAPEDGAWRFSTDQYQSRVLVFTGDSVTALRLVSGYPSSIASVPVKADAEYRIAVAAENAFSSGRSFNLEWKKYERTAGADDFANAIELTGASGSEPVAVDDSVEPDEPAQTGVRTRWWQWTAPSSGRFTWRLADTSYTSLKVAVFSTTGADGEDSAETSLAALQLVASTGPRVTSTELSFKAVGDRRYWISVGFHNDDDAAFSFSRSATLKWGEAPANDSLAQAIALVVNSGSTKIPNGFATLAPDEPSGVLGHSSLWWSFTPSNAGWYRFWVEDAETATLAVYRVSGAGFDGLERVARSHGDWQAPHEADTTSVLFDAVAEQRYLIRVGQRGNDTDAEWTLNWEEARAPTWLRYAGRLLPSALGLTPQNAPTSATLAFEDHGDVLYMGTFDGLHVLARDASSGALEQMHIVEMEEPQALLWAPTREKLYAFIGCVWRQLAPSDDSRSTLVDEGALQIVHGDPPPCDMRTAFMDATGVFLHHGHADGMEVYAFSGSGLGAVPSLWMMQSVEIDNFKHAVAGTSTLVYATDGNSLEVFEREPGTGPLAAVSEVELGIRAVAIAISDDGYLVALSEDGSTVAYAQATPPSAPRHVNTLAAFGNASWRDADGNCRFIAARPGTGGIDAFCRNSAFSAAIRTVDESAKLEATDYVANWQADRFNNYIPPFESRALAISPDGQHAYVYSKGEILIFERIGNRVP